LVSLHVANHSILRRSASPGFGITDCRVLRAAPRLPTSIERWALSTLNKYEVLLARAANADSAACRRSVSVKSRVLSIHAPIPAMPAMIAKTTATRSARPKRRSAKRSRRTERPACISRSSESSAEASWCRRVASESQARIMISFNSSSSTRSGISVRPSGRRGKLFRSWPVLIS